MLARWRRNWQHQRDVGEACSAASKHKRASTAHQRTRWFAALRPAYQHRASEIIWQLADAHMVLYHAEPGEQRAERRRRRACCARGFGVTPPFAAPAFSLLLAKHRFSAPAVSVLRSLLQLGV
jgi:hypothetical protein